MKTKHKSVVKNTFWTALAFYLLIGFEFLYMASPFAAYFYSIYRPGLESIDNYPSVSWVTGFFLPHLVEETKSPIINLLKPAGAFIAAAGLLIFLICAGQVYYAKLFKKGVVKGGLYKYIRHPQYSAFILCSFGLLILWPRYLVMIMFITLLFVYYFLARVEEKECESKFGESYTSYKNSAGMFLPFKFIPMKFLSGYRINTGIKIISLPVLYLLIIFLSVQIADNLKSYSVKSLYTLNSGESIYLSMFRKESSDLKKIIDLTMSDKLGGSVLKDNSKKHISYILPADMYLSEIPMVKPENALNHMLNSEYSPTEIKVIITEAVIKGNADKNVLSNTVYLKPEAEIWIDLSANKVIKSHRSTIKNIRYKNIPEPVF